MRSPHALRQRVSESWLHATAFVAISLWGLLWIGAAIWPYHRGLWGYGWGLVAGFTALAVAAKVAARWLKGSDALFGIVFANIMQTFVLSALLIHCLPHFRVGLSLPDAPQAVDLGALARERPALPSYVTVTGQLRSQLTIHDVYQPSPTKQDRNPRPIAIAYTPLVSRGWNPTEPVTVLVDGANPQNQTTWTGILYPFVPQAREPGPLINPMLHIGGIGSSLDWLQARANFQVEPDYLYLLMPDESPAQMRLRLYIVLVLFGIYLLVITWLYVRPRKQS
jgi:hypothetical protein